MPPLYARAGLARLLCRFTITNRTLPRSAARHLNALVATRAALNCSTPRAAGRCDAGRAGRRAGLAFPLPRAAPHTPPRLDDGRHARSIRHAHGI